ncbi:MAG: hypothetical protein HOG05_09115 [Bacteroidetes bacterium]|nr:hypothetical protein [Bacteroidota bacterium]MBT5529296.1 hypothetical protein [Cytophagia bacterium]MBT3801301.1 hypothetical protein [Bacteroidota bacterium]MBT3934927.1 hypothetical protein [Bacteroidota bacterium]MBT4969923.1 hypothetical protein [Bacteroidota bacterium]
MQKLFTLILFIALASSTFAQVNSYNGYKWGTPYSEMEDKLVPSDNKIPGYKSYEMKNQEMKFEGFTVHTLSYVFKKNVFYGVNIGFYSKDKETILALLTKKYGEPKAVETPFVVNYEWHLEKTAMALTYLPTNQGDKSLSFTMGKKK